MGTLHRGPRDDGLEGVGPMVAGAFTLGLIHAGKAEALTVFCE